MRVRAALEPRQNLDALDVVQIHLQREDAERGDILLGYDLRWQRSTVAGPPLDLLRLVNELFQVASFEYVPASAE